MKYYIIPSINGVLDIDYRHLKTAVEKTASEYYVAVLAEALVRDSWQEITEEEFISVLPVKKEDTDIQSVDDRLTNIENTLDLLLLKQEGII